MTHCTHCGHEIALGTAYCPICGATQESLQAPATGRLESHHLLHNRYLIVQKLAQGGQSAVYLAYDTLDGSGQRAIKEMSESGLDDREREKAINGFMREARMLYTLQHPALARVYDMFVEESKHYLVMEHVAGQNLEDVMMHAGRPLEWERVGRWGMALCDVFAYLHAQNPPVIYRDLKPPNIMLTPDGAIKLVDFGIARWLHPDRQQDTMQLGTDGYAPPEQYSAHSEPRSDLYALGATMYHLLTGRVPEAAPLRLNGRALAPIHAYNPTIPEPAERVVLQSLSLQAQDRFVNAAKLREAIEWTLRGPVRESGHTHTTPRVAAGHAMTELKQALMPSGRGAASNQPPRLHVAPLRLDAGLLDPGQCPLFTLDVSNRGGGELRGRTETNLTCLTVEPALLEQDTPTLRIRIDTTNLAAGPYVCHIALRTNGGDQIIPVRFAVRARLDPRIAFD